MSLRSQLRKMKAILLPQTRPAKKIDLNHQILVGTHHKAGTVWLLKIFQQVCREFGLRLCHGEAGQIPNDCDVLLPRHSRFDFERLRAPRKGVHMIRDPRDIIVSGCFYHQRSREPWLHVKHARYGGLTYQEKINSYASFDDQLLFEMENCGLNSIRDILEWNYRDPAFIEVKYEDLISDHQLILFHTIFAFLGFSEQAIPRALQISYDNSVFSGALANTPHIRSGQIRQWEKYFGPAPSKRFLELFGDDALVKLGYEGDSGWAAPQSRQVMPRIPSDESRGLRRLKPTASGNAWHQRDAA